MKQYEYQRIMDNHHESTFDSLEKQCTEQGKLGWKVISISDGSQYRYATMEREINDNIENSERSRLQTQSIKTGEGNGTAKGRTPRNKAST